MKRLFLRRVAGPAFSSRLPNCYKTQAEPQVIVEPLDEMSRASSPGAATTASPSATPAGDSSMLCRKPVAGAAAAKHS